MNKKKSKENRNISILFHNISYYYRNDMEMPESEQEHVTRMINEGYSSGELNWLNENRGWWRINNNEKINLTINKEKLKKVWGESTDGIYHEEDSTLHCNNAYGCPECEQEMNKRNFIPVKDNEGELYLWKYTCYCSAEFIIYND